MNVLDFKIMKQESRKISMVTCYDYWTAKIIEESSVDCVLVGDSVAMVMHGYPSTLYATTDLMATHVQAVSRGLAKKFLIADMPFGSFRKGLVPAMEAVETLMRAGTSAVKLEGVWGHEDVVEHIVKSGVPVMAHIGLTPQSVHQLGGFKVQGKDKETSLDLINQAKRLQDLGCFSIVLECVPAPLAELVTSELKIPTIGIGAGANVDGQVLVLQDLIGVSNFNPKFIKQFSTVKDPILAALNSYAKEVRDKVFPSSAESYL